MPSDRRKSVFWPVVAAALLFAGPAPAARSVDETRPLDPDGQVEIEIVAGSVQVVGWDRPEVRITGTLGDDLPPLEIEGSSRKLRVGFEMPSHRSWGDRDVRADLEIHVPRGCRLGVETVSAGIEVAGVGGALDLESVSGAITVSGAASAVETATVSGRIVIRGEGVPVRADSVSGRVELEGVAGRVDVETVSGGIHVSGRDVERGELESVSGEIRFEASLKGSARLDVEAHSGNVTLLLPADLSAAVRAETFSGDIRNEFGPQARRTQKYGPGKSLEFTAGGGDARISVESFSGNVVLKRAG